MPEYRRSWWRAAPFMLGLLLLCGFTAPADSPGGIGGTGIQPGGIGGTGITAIGVIQRFGSIYVNGREYLLKPDTRYFVDGALATTAALHLGDKVVVQAREDHGHAVAAEVHIERAMVGRITGKDTNGRSLQILGQQVQVTADTRLEAGASGVTAAFADLQVGATVVVSGFYRGDGRWLATRMTTLSGPGEPPPPGPGFRLRGRIQSIDAQRSLLRLDGTELPVAMPKIGRIPVGAQVIVAGTYADGRPRIERITRVQPPTLVTGSRIVVLGYLRRTAAAWTCDGIALRISPATVFGGGSATNLPNGHMIVAEGTVLPDGTVAVDRITVHVRPADFGLSPAQAPSHGHGEGNPGEMDRPEMSRPSIMRPQISRPQISRPEIQRPEIERPQIQRPQINHPTMMPGSM